MNKLKVAFFGTPEFAKNSLKAICESKHEVVGVVTATDKASGRGQKLNQSAVKEYAVEHHLPLLQPEKLKDAKFLENIQQWHADIFVVVAFRMMPKVLFEMPQFGTFNLHASLLPDYRGAAPINFAIINGEKETGVTTFFINEKIDEGNIILQEKIAIEEGDTAGSLHDKLMELGAELVVKTLDGIAENSLQEKPQNQIENPKNAFKIFKEDTKINWEKPGIEIYNFVRGMSPYPSAFTQLSIKNEIKNLKILNGVFVPENHNKEVREININKNDFKIYVKDGYYQPLEVQLEGKKKMSVKDFLNGFQTFEDMFLIR